MDEKKISTLIEDLSKFATFAHLSHQNGDHDKTHERLKKVFDLAQLALVGYGEYLKIKNMGKE